MVFGKRTEANMAPTQAHAGQRTAGLRSPFLSAEKFQGNRPGYHYADGKQGKGYYRDVSKDDNFLARLAEVEAREGRTPTGGAPEQHDGNQRLPYRYLQQSQHHADYRQQHAYEQQQMQRPEWARVQAEGLTEATIAFQPPKREEHIQRVGASRNRRNHFGPLPSQIDFGQMGQPHATPSGSFLTTQEVMYPRDGPLAAATLAVSSSQMKAAGGRSNLAGPTNGHGERENLIGHGVNFLS